MTDKVYYGIGKKPEDARRPTMIESVMAGQVRWHGVRKVDPTLLNSKITIENKVNKKQIRLKIVELRGRFARITKDLKFDKKLTDQEKRKLAEEAMQIKRQMPELQKQLEDLEKQGDKVKYKITLKKDYIDATKVPKKRGRPAKPKVEKKPVEKKPRTKRPKKLKAAEVSKLKRKL
jgi:predicted  nucleic acid-binding Zn-ribbon protein